jgi:hypothetical protein
LDRETQKFGLSRSVAKFMVPAMSGRSRQNWLKVFLVFAVVLTLLAPAEAGPLNFGRQFIVVTDFGADPTGSTDSDLSVQTAINSCSSAGCTVYFPAGHYALLSVPALASSFLTIPSGVPVTLAGNGQGSSVLEPNISANADVVQTAAGSTSFSMHDLGVSFGAVPTGGATVRVISSMSTSLYDLSINGAYDAIALGQVGATTGQAISTNIRGVNALNVQHCFLNLTGGVLDTYVRGSYAQAANSTTSQPACTPSTQGTGAFGVNGLHVREARFVGFARGFDFAVNQAQLSNLLFDNVSLDNASGGPALELYIPSGSASLVSNVSVTNSSFQSSATACVLHGAVSAIHLRNVTCNGGAAGALPSSCAAVPSSRGYAALSVSGTGGSGSPQTVSITVTPPLGSPRSAMVTVAPGESSSAIASALGTMINTSTLVTGGGCPYLLPVATYNDATGIDASIGSEIELFSYEYGPGLTPAISASAGSGPVGISVLNGATSFAAADGFFVGMPNATTFPTGVSIASSHASMALYGAGLHLQGASALLVSGSTFGDPIAQNAYGVWVDGSSSSYSANLLQDNNLSNATTAAAYFGGGTGSGFGPNVQFSSNAGYNPPGNKSASIGCSTTLINPFPFSVEVYISGPFSSIAKNGTTIFTGAFGITSNDTVQLGANESITVTCTPGPTPITAWFGE